MLCNHSCGLSSVSYTEENARARRMLTYPVSWEMLYGVHPRDGNAGRIVANSSFLTFIVLKGTVGLTFQFSPFNQKATAKINMTRMWPGTRHNQNEIRRGRSVF